MTDEENALEVEALRANPQVPNFDGLPNGIELVQKIIASQDGGVSGLNPYIALKIDVLDERDIQYILVDRQTGASVEYRVTVEVA